MGATASKRGAEASGASSTASACPALPDAAQPPVSAAGPSEASSSACPVPERLRRGPVYNVYNQRIDDLAAGGAINPANNMPAQPAQQPWPGQRRPLSTERMQSNIPKGGTDAAWVYPSPQMFYNSLKRKGKGDDVTEEVMDAVVHAHNTMNELTWQRVLEWEALHRAECGQPCLRRFMGQPDKLSPLARLSSWLGGPLPFDRHDWWVDRCGREVRYVIDFYFHDDKAGTPEAFTLRVRPALDSPEAAVDRLKMRIYTTCAKYGWPCPITGHAGSFTAGQASSQTEQHS